MSSTVSTKMLAIDSGKVKSIKFAGNSSIAIGLMDGVRVCLGGLRKGSLKIK